MSQNDICVMLYLLFIDILTGSAGQGLQIGRVLQYRLFLSLVISLKGGEGGGRGGRGRGWGKGVEGEGGGGGGSSAEMS
jgi:hypothetical protein